MGSDKLTDIKVEQKIFKRIEIRILNLERDNYKTKKLSPTEMSEKIRKIIEFEVDKHDD